MPSWFSAWRSGVRARRAIAPYVAYLMSEPDTADVEWLAEAATAGDADHAVWELRYARRALGLIVAQRDALDDRTASMVAAELASATRADRNVAAARVALAERQFGDRLSAFRDMLQLRGGALDADERLGRTLLMLAGAPRVTPDDLQHAAVVAGGYLAGANQALRQAMGEPNLPPDVRPSAVRR